MAGLQDVPDRRRSDALSQRGDDTPGHENVLRHSDLQGGFKDVTGLGPPVKPLARNMSGNFAVSAHRPVGYADGGCSLSRGLDLLKELLTTIAGPIQSRSR